MQNNLPVGVFDSGLGGLTVVKEFIKVLPNENFIYLGDTARVPYGTRSKEIIKKFSLEDSEFLISKKVKCIIIACNTSSAVAAKFIKSKLKTPVFDVVSPVNNLSLQNVGLIGTRATINSKAYRVNLSVACPLFVPFIEEAQTNSEALKIVAKNYLKDFKNIDTLILGCTHYPIIENLIQKIVGDTVNLINPAVYVINELKTYLEKNNLVNKQKVSGKRQYYVTDLNERFVSVAEMFLGEKIMPDLKKTTL